MNRREILGGTLALSVMASSAQPVNGSSNSFLELSVWYLHNSPEGQEQRVSEYLQHGLAPALERSATGAHLAAAFTNLIASNGPFYVSLAEYPSLAAYEQCLGKLAADSNYQAAMAKMSDGGGLPFVRVESSLLRCFDIQKHVASAERSNRVFELRTYESQSMAALKRKVGMFNQGEAGIFQRLGMRPVFFGETLVGPKQPNLMYMLSYDDLAARDHLWKQFGGDPEWKKLSSQPELKDSQIVANISNVILKALPFSPIQ